MKLKEIEGKWRMEKSFKRKEYKGLEINGILETHKKEYYTGQIFCMIPVLTNWVLLEGLSLQEGDEVFNSGAEISSNGQLLQGNHQVPEGSRSL